MRTETACDAAGRRRRSSTAAAPRSDSAAEFRYAAGRLASVARRRARRRARDATPTTRAGRVASVRYPTASASSSRYDLRSRVVEERYLAASGVELRRLRFAYDLADREIEVRDGATPLRTLRIAGGRVVEERFGNGLVRTYAYAAHGRAREGDRDARRGRRAVESTSARAGAARARRGTLSTTTFGRPPAHDPRAVLARPGRATTSPGRACSRTRRGVGRERDRAYAYDALGNLVADRALAASPERSSSSTRSARGSCASAAAAARLRHEYAYDEAGYASLRDGEAIAWDGAGRAASVGAARPFPLGRARPSGSAHAGRRLASAGSSAAAASPTASGLPSRSSSAR